MPITQQGNRYYTVTTGTNSITNTNVGDLTLEDAVYYIEDGARLRFANPGNQQTFTNCLFVEDPSATTVPRAMTDAESRFPNNGNYVFEDCEFVFHQAGRNDVEIEEQANITFRNTTMTLLATNQTFCRFRQNTTLDNFTFRTPYATISIAFHPLMFVKGNGRVQSFTMVRSDPNDVRNRAALLFDGASNTAAAANTTYRINNLTSPNIALWSADNSAILELIDPTNTNGTNRLLKSTDAAASNRGILQGWRTLDVGIKELEGNSYSFYVNPVDNGQVMVGEGDPQDEALALSNQTQTSQSLYVKEYQQSGGTYTVTETQQYQVRIRTYTKQVYDSGVITVEGKVSLSATLLDDNNVTLSETEANTLTGITIDFTNETITLTEARTLSEIYDYWKAQFVRQENLQHTTPITWNGNLLDIGDYTINGTEFIRG